MAVVAKGAMTKQAMVDRLLAAVPEFAGVLAEHLEDNEGELLGHPLMFGLVQFMEEARRAGSDELVARIIAFADEALRTGDDYVENAICVSFVEMVGPWEPEQQEFISTWPAALQDEARHFGWPA